MMPLWHYRVLIRMLSPLLLGYTAWRSFRDGGWRYWHERQGHVLHRAPPADRHADGHADRHGADIQALNQAEQAEQLWVHAASVGEVITVLPLIKAWQADRAGACVLVTTATPTGAAVLQQQALPGIRHRYLPVDLPGACRRFVDTLDTRTGWIVETEIWPWLYAHCARRSIGLTIINGRLSRRTLRHSDGILGRNYRHALSGVRVLARSAEDRDHFIALGAEPGLVETVGNLKYAVPVMSELPARLLERPCVVAASTHDDEELQLVRAWNALQPPGLLLVIVPRHPERGPALQKQLQSMGVSVARRSAGELPAADDQVYLADTLGELPGWYATARSSFVGGSLITRGGHNMLEPARFACPTIVGPHTQNFDDIMRLMIQAQAIGVASDADAVVAFLAGTALDEAEYTAMAERARQLAEDSQHVLQRYLNRLA